MENKKKIINLHKEKIKNLKRHNKLYFTDDRPQISDSKYDKIKSEIIALEEKYTFLKENSVSKIIGSSPSVKFKKIKHLKPMLSLSNSFKESDMKDFLKKIKNFLNFQDKEIQLYSEPKIDGISATLIYENGKLSKGLSRGDGFSGDILENLKTISSIPVQINSKDIPDLIEIRCEIFIGKKDFEKIRDNFANPRTLLEDL